MLQQLRQHSLLVEFLTGEVSTGRFFLYHLKIKRCIISFNIFGKSDDMLNTEIIHTRCIQEEQASCASLYILQNCLIGLLLFW